MQLSPTNICNKRGAHKRRRARRKVTQTWKYKRIIQPQFKLASEQPIMHGQDTATFVQYLSTVKEERQVIEIELEKQTTGGSDLQQYNLRPNVVWPSHPKFNLVNCPILATIPTENGFESHKKQACFIAY